MAAKAPSEFPWIQMTSLNNYPQFPRLGNIKQRGAGEIQGKILGVRVGVITHLLQEKNVPSGALLDFDLADQAPKSHLNSPLSAVKQCVFTPCTYFFHITKLSIYQKHTL